MPETAMRPYYFPDDEAVDALVKRMGGDVRHYAVALLVAEHEITFQRGRVARRPAVNRKVAGSIPAAGAFRRRLAWYGASAVLGWREFVASAKNCRGRDA